MDISNKTISRFVCLAAIFFVLLNSCSKPAEQFSFDLIKEFPHVKSVAQTERITPSQTWDNQYRTFGWVRNSRVDESAILIPKKRRRAIFSIGSLDRNEKRITVRIKSLLPQTSNNQPELKILLNGHSIFSVQFDWDKYKEVSIVAGENCVFRGENYLEFQLYPDDYEIQENYWLALNTIKIHESSKLFSPSPLRVKEVNKIQTSKNLFGKKQYIEQSLNTALCFDLKIPRYAKLIFDYSLASPDFRILSGEKLHIFLDTAKGESHNLYNENLSKEHQKRKSRVELDLSDYAGQISRISFVFQKDSLDRNFSARLRLWKPRIETKKVETKKEKISSDVISIPKPFNILIYLVDCLRPDHLPFFGYEKNVAPHMTEFSKDSVIFKKAFAQSSWTRTSVGALFTGFHPFIQKAISLKSGLGDEYITLAEILKETGYRTIGISSNIGVREYYGFDQGFDYFRFHSYREGGVSYELNKYAVSQLEGAQIPFFLYVHTMDPHRPYNIKEEFCFDVPEESSDPSRLVEVNNGSGDKYFYDLQHVLALYDASIRQNDKSFGDLVHELKRLDQYNNTMIILMSDHGEEFFEHGDFAHGGNLYQETLQQLLVIKLPNQIMAGRIVNENVQEIDILPTILDLLGENRPPFFMGKTLKNFLISPQNPDSSFHGEIFAETGVDLKVKAMIDGYWKIIHDGKEWFDFPEEYEIYDLLSDPAEKNNLFLRNPLATEYLKRRIKKWAQKQKELSYLGEEGLLKKLGKKEIEELRALGYIR